MNFVQSYISNAPCFALYEIRIVIHSCYATHKKVDSCIRCIVIIVNLLAILLCLSVLTNSVHCIPMK